jgi:hypothetical protein
MNLTTTFTLLRRARACTSRYKFLRESLKDVKDDEPINLITILETNGLDDALWALCATAENCDKVARLMAADFAEQVIPIWKKYSQDKRPELAIKAARDFAEGRITRDELAAAEAAAVAAARAAAEAAAEAATEAAARAAGASASVAATRAAVEAGAWAATWAAMRAAGASASVAAARAAAEAAQVKIFIGYLQP